MASIGGVTNKYTKKTLLYFSASLGFTVLGILVAVWGLLLLSVIALYVATFLLLRGLKFRARGRRIKEEAEWWKRARSGVEQDPLYPCCVLFGKTLVHHAEEYCTRRRYPKPRIITKEELVEIDRKWKEIIEHLDDPEYGEEK